MRDFSPNPIPQWRYLIYDTYRGKHIAFENGRVSYRARATAPAYTWAEACRIAWNHYACVDRLYRFVRVPGNRIVKNQIKRQRSFLAELHRDLLTPYKKKHKARMSPAILAYLPPDPKFNGEIFLSNMRKFKTKYPIIFFSDNWPDPDVFKLRMNPDKIRNASGLSDEQRRWIVNNILFFTAMQIASQCKHTHMLYVEADSRVGCDYWDDKVFTEFFSHPGAICGGSLVVYNPCNGGLKAAQRWAQVCATNTRKNFPIATYGFKGAADNSGSCVFVNGSLGVYDVPRLSDFFDMTNAHRLAATCTAWDMEIGKRIWAKYGDDAYDYVVHLTSVYSSYGDALSTESMRMDMLRKGDVVAVHQCKSPETV